MSTDAQILIRVVQAFDAVERPQHCVANHQHCEECAEYDALLQAHDRLTLTSDHVANPAADPFGFCTPHAKAYYLPNLTRFALEGPDDNSPYAMQLLGHLEGDGADNALIRYCSLAQRQAISAFLAHLIETRTSTLDSYSIADQALRTYEHWEAAAR